MARNDEVPAGWEKIGVPWALAGVLLPIIGVGLFLYAAVAMARDVVIVREYKSASGKLADSRVIATGMVQPGVTLRSPGGADGAAWITWLTRKKGKSTTIECVLAQAEGLQIEGVGRVDFTRPGEPIAVGTNMLRGRLEEPVPALVLGETRTPKDLAAVGRACAAQLAARGVAASETMASEQVLLPGTTVHVMGCRSSDASRIVPCGNGLDLLSVWPIEYHASEHRRVALIFAAAGMGGWFVLFLMLGIGALKGAPRQRRGRSS